MRQGGGKGLIPDHENGKNNFPNRLSVVNGFYFQFPASLKGLSIPSRNICWTGQWIHHKERSWQALSMERGVSFYVVFKVSS